MKDNVAEAMTAQTKDGKPMRRVFQIYSLLHPIAPQTQRMKSGGANVNSFPFINYYINILLKYTS